MSRSVRQILRNSVLQTINVYTVTCINFLLLLIYTRALSVEQVGAIMTAQAQVLVWVMLVDLGLYGGLVNALTQAESDKSDLSRQGFRAWDLVLRVLGLRFAGALIGTIVVLCLAFLHAGGWSGNWNTSIFWLDVAFIPHLYALAFHQTVTAYVNFRGRFFIAVVGNVIGVLVSAVLSAYLAFQGADLPIILAAQSWGGFLGGSVILLGLWCKPSHSKPSRRLENVSAGSWNQEAWRSIFRDAWPYALIFAASVLWQRLDQISASHFLGFEAGAQYGVTVRLMAIPMMVANAIYIAIVPDIQRVGRDAPEKIIIYVGAIGKILFRYGLPIALFLLLLIYWVVIPFFPKYESSRTLLFWFAPGIWGYWLHNFVIGALFGLRRFKEVVWVHAYALGVYVISLLVLIQLFGLVGVAWSYNFFCLSLTFFALRALKKTGHLEKNFSLAKSYSRQELEFIALVRERIKPWVRVGA